jgi:hypothetical protein
LKIREQGELGRGMRDVGYWEIRGEKRCRGVEVLRYKRILGNQEIGYRVLEKRRGKGKYVITKL